MAIDDNTSYELTGYQVKDLAQKIRAKADTSALAPVATSNLYSDLTGKPTIPTVYNGTLTIKQDGVTVGTFSANQSTNNTINLSSGGMYKESVYLFCGNVNYALYGGNNLTYDGYIGRFYTAIGDPMNTQEIPYTDVLSMIGDPNTDLEIIGFVRNDDASTAPLHTLFHQITDDKYSYQYDLDRDCLSVVITGVDITKAAPTSFREQLTFDYSNFIADHYAAVVERKALTPLVIYFANTLPTTDTNTHLPFLSIADVKDGTSIASDFNSEYVSRYMSNYVNVIEGCELEWRVYDVAGDKVEKVYRADVIDIGVNAEYYLYDYDDTNSVPEVHRYTTNMQYVYLANTWSPSGGSTGPKVVFLNTISNPATATAGDALIVTATGYNLSSINGWMSLVNDFNNGAILTFGNGVYSIWTPAAMLRITGIEVALVGGSQTLSLYFDGPGAVKRIQVATTYGSDPITVTLEA